MSTEAGSVRESVVRVFRGDSSGGQEVEYRVPIEPGMVVLDAIHWIQAHQAPDLAVRWNCKAAKCGSCSAEVNGKPSLMCKTRMDRFREGEAVSVRPMKTFPLVRDLVTDVSWNFEVNKRIVPFNPREGAEWKWQQSDVDRVQEFRKCIECFPCQDVCRVLRAHEMKHRFAGPRFLVRIAALEMHPIDGEGRTKFLKDTAGLGLCKHHQVLHRSVPRGHPHHRQCDHPAEGAGGGPALRLPEAVVEHVAGEAERRHLRGSP